MAMFAPIPMPGNGNEVFKDVMDYYEQLQKRKAQQQQFAEEQKRLNSEFSQQAKMKQPLIEAQAMESRAKASKAQIMANLLNMALGSGTNGTNAGNANAIQQSGYNPTAEETQKIQEMQPGESLTLGQEESSSSMPAMGAQNNNKQKSLEMLQALGILKETPAQQEEREKRTEYEKELGKSDVRQLDKWNEMLTSNSQITPVLETIQEISANPAFQEMYKNPEYFGYDLAYLKRFGTPEQQDMITSLGTNAKSIFQAMGQEFKGAFREFELNLFNKAAPDETKDTLQQIISKTNTMLALRNLMTKRMTLASNIVRGSAGKISPSNAMEIADKQINAKSVREGIKKRFEQEQAAHKKKKGENSYEVEIYSPQGKLVARGSKEQASKFLNEHKGYYQKVLSNGQ